MIFANTALLWGLALASVPIIIYLLNRRKFKRMTWAAMEFLLQALKKNRRRLRVENLLLLIIRTAIVLLFVFALARPLIKSTGIFSAIGRLKKNWIIVVDNSYSMGYKTGPTTSLERAVKAARSFVEKLENGDKVVVIKMNSSPEPLYETPVTMAGSKDVKAVLADINEIRLSYKTTNAPKTLDKVIEILDKFESVPPGAQAKEEKTVFIISDCQYNSWAEQDILNNKHLERLSHAFKRRKAELQVLDVGETEAPNFAIIDLYCDHALIGTEMPVRFEATIKNFSKREFSDVVISLMVDDLPQRSVTIQLQPGDPKKVSFTYQFKDRGFHHVQVSAKTDPLDADNEAYLAIKVREEVKVLVVDGRPSSSAWESETDYLRAFFEAGFSEEDRRKTTPFTGTFKTHMEFETMIQSASSGRLGAFDVVLLANLSDLTPEAEEALSRYVEEGGSVLMFLGDMVIPERYNLILFREGNGPLPVRLKDVVGDPECMTDIALKIESFDHPTVSFFQNWPLALRNPMAFLYYDNELPERAEDTFVIATYSDGNNTPAIVEKKFGRGKLVLVTTSAYDEWNNWNKYQFFPIFLSESLSYLGQSTSTDNYMVGEVYQRVLTTPEWASEVYIMPPTGESFPVHLEKMAGPDPEAENTEDDEGDARFVLTHEKTDVSGIYRVVFTGEQNVPGERVEKFAVNVDTRDESDMTKLVQPELRSAMPGLEPKPTITHYSDIKRDIGKTSKEAGGREFWKYFLAAVLILLALESLLAQRFSKHER